jgi:alpha-tubulin suppressor-like RCC1 family protein
MNTYKSKITMKRTKNLLLQLILFNLFFIGKEFITEINAQKMAGGYYHSYFLCADGTVNACGYNFEGQLGNGTNTGGTAMVAVSNLTDVVSIACGRGYGMALRSDSTLWTWGENYYGQLGTGDLIHSNIPIQVEGLSGIVAMDGSYHSIALKSDSTVWTWGYNSWGAIGNGFASNDPTLELFQVPGLSDVIAVDAAFERSVALKSDSTVWTWGVGFWGALGTGFNNSSYTPVQIPGLTGVIDIASSDVNCYALKADGTVWACGFNEDGALGNGTFNNQLANISSMVQIPGISDVIAIDDGSSFVAFLKSDGTVWMCGNNNFGQLGIGGTTDSNVVVQVPSMNNIVAIDCGTLHMLALRSDDTVWSWGYSNEGQTGNSLDWTNDTPEQITTVCSMITGIEEENQSNQSLVVYPNPANDQITIRLGNAMPGNFDRLFIMDQTGKIIWRSTQVLQNMSIDIAHLSAGVYTLSVLREHSTAHQTFVKIN